MNIIETNLSFGGMSYRSATRRIILHHAEATSCTAADIHRWHKEGNHWAGAGYHFLVRKDGKVYRLRPEWAVGAHAAGANSDSLGICFEGAYNVETMRQTQIDPGGPGAGELSQRQVWHLSCAAPQGCRADRLSWQ